MLRVIYKIYRSIKLNLSLDNILYNGIEFNVGIYLILNKVARLSPILFSLLLDDLGLSLDKTK